MEVCFLSVHPGVRCCRKLTDRRRWDSRALLVVLTKLSDQLLMDRVSVGVQGPAGGSKKTNDFSPEI